MPDKDEAQEESGKQGVRGRRGRGKQNCRDARSFLLDSTHESRKRMPIHTQCLQALARTAFLESRLVYLIRCNRAFVVLRIQQLTTVVFATVQTFGDSVPGKMKVCRLTSVVFSSEGLVYPLTQYCWPKKLSVLRNEKKICAELEHEPPLPKKILWSVRMCVALPVRVLHGLSFGLFVDVAATPVP